MSGKNKYFKLFACCIPVSGSIRAGICDLQRGTFDTIPIGLYEILNKYKNVSHSKILLEYGQENYETINDFFNWLTEKEFGFWCDSKKEAIQFSEMSLEWDAPFEISNIIIDLSQTSDVDYNSVFKEIIMMGIPHVQLRSYTLTNIDFFVSLLALINGSRVKTVDIITPFIDNLDIETIKKICREYLLINSITFHGSPNDESLDLLDGLTKIIYSKEQIFSAKCCGKISLSQLAINIPLYTESQKYNTCLNGKISIDVNGNIKNCPSMNKKFGNIKDKTFQDVLDDTTFKNLWQINKDKIDVCKDCEFRHICTDCRAYLENPYDIYSKPLKCGYNPYTATWEDWSTNPLKNKAIIHYGMQELIKLK